MNERDTDIVTRLRAVLHEDRRVELMNRDATDEIERLQSQLESVAEELVAARAEIEQLNIQHREAEPLLNELWERRTEATEMRAEIERLRAGGCARDQRLTQYCAEAAAMQAELAACRGAYQQAVRDRDTARLAYCRDVWKGVGDEDEQRQLTPREIAGRQGWPWPIPGAEVAR